MRRRTPALSDGRAHRHPGLTIATLPVLVRYLSEGFVNGMTAGASRAEPSRHGHRRTGGRDQPLGYTGAPCGTNVESWV
jgi:hypothetical protein